jgi:hypothetical protein
MKSFCKTVREDAELARPDSYGRVASSSHSRLSDAAQCRSRCDCVRRLPVASSQGFFLFAPQVGQRTTNVCFTVSAFMPIVMLLS